MHYHNRYKAHTDSSKLESKLKETILEKVSISEEKESRLRDFSWVTNGLYRLFRSRRVLSYSYPFAFYMFGEELFKDEMTVEEREIKQNLFEDQQQQLESNVEKLSKFLEEPFEQYTDDKVMEIRMQVINLSTISAGKFRSKKPPPSFLARFREEHSLSAELLEPEGLSCCDMPPAMQCVGATFKIYSTSFLNLRTCEKRHTSNHRIY